MKTLLSIFVACTLLSVAKLSACASIIIMGKATPDGRPLMWKHRDTSVPFNHIFRS